MTMTLPLPAAEPADPSMGALTGIPHLGMPPLDEEGAPVSFFEFWPMKTFYVPIALYSLWLMLRYRGITLPTVANPTFPGGGFYGESKSAILDLLMRHAARWTAAHVTHDRPSRPGPAVHEADTALGLLAAAGLGLPVVAKPDIGCRGAGVRLVRTREELIAYIDAFPAGARMVLQRYVDQEGEAGVFYVRRPGEDRGRIFSLTLKYFPYVIGNGRSTLRELILADRRAGTVPHLYLPRHAQRLDWVPPAGHPVRLAFSGSHSKGSIFRNGTHLVTPAMEARFEEIARSLPEFHFGRFDVRFADFGALAAGEGFTIVEANGAGAEATHIWDRSTGLWQAWATLMEQYRLLYEIGAANRRRGFRPLSLKAFRALYRREQELTPLYPPTQ